MSNRRRRRAWLALLALTLPVEAAAWWPEGHELVDGAALDVLPGDGPAILREEEAAVTGVSYSPDVWAEAGGKGLRSAERHNHYVDLELLRGRELPPTRPEYERMLAELDLRPEGVGAAPYAIVEAQARLTLAFARLRAFPGDPAARVEAVFHAGVLAHYAADLAQPLHTTVHFDGRAGGDGRSPRTGIHAKVDALLRQARLGRLEVAFALEVRREDPWRLVLDALAESHALVDRVYELEGDLPDAEGHPPKEMRPELRAFALERARAAARLVASLWQSAWEASTDAKLPRWLKARTAGHLDSPSDTTPSVIVLPWRHAVRGAADFGREDASQPPGGGPPSPGGDDVPVARLAD